MAPEIFDLELGYDFSYDIWSLGCFMYELVVGEPPFGVDAETKDDVKHELLTKEVQMKDYFSNDFKDILYKILDKSINSRIGLDEIMRHPFFKKVNWDQLGTAIGLKPPIKPNVKKAINVTKADTF